MSVEIQHLYLVSAQLDADCNIIASSARPVGNTFLTLENQNTVVFDKGNDPAEYNKQAIEKGRQLYLTDVVGSIGNFVNGKHVDGVKQRKEETFEQRTNIEIEEKVLKKQSWSCVPPPPMSSNFGTSARYSYYSSTVFL